MKNSSQDNNYKTNNNQDDKQNNNQENNNQDRLKIHKNLEEIDKEKLIGRQEHYLAIFLRGKKMMLNTHGIWQSMSVLLTEYSNEKIDVLKTMTMLLIHDIQ